MQSNDEQCYVELVAHVKNVQVPHLSDHISNVNLYFVEIVLQLIELIRTVTIVQAPMKHRGFRVVIIKAAKAKCSSD